MPRHRLRRLVDSWNKHNDVPKLGQKSLRAAKAIARNGYAGRVQHRDLPAIREELQREPSLYLLELSDRIRTRTGRKYSRKALIACLWKEGYTLKALTHRARAADDLKRAQYLLAMRHCRPEQLVFVDET